jgi:hypothetical protein
MLLHDNHLSVQTVAKEISFKQMARGVILATNVVVLVEGVLHIVILKPGQTLHLNAINVMIILCSYHYLLVEKQKLMSPLINNSSQMSKNGFLIQSNIFVVP